MGTWFRKFALTFVLGLAGATTASAQRMHVLLVADQSPWAHWGTYAPNLTFDMLHMSEFLETNTPEHGLEVSYLSMLYDQDSAPSKVLDSIRRMKPARNDTVLFYFTGHGGLDDRGSFFSLAGGKLYRDDVRKQLTSLNARMTVLLTDCCNSRGDGRLEVALAPFYPRPEKFTPLFKALFFDPSGVVDINSSAPGESAFFLPPKGEGVHGDGSLFTSALADWAREHAQSRPTWSEMLREVSVKVHLSFRENFPKGVSMAKGLPLQTDQNVFARSYPGMPAAGGYRAGIQIRDNDGYGAVITEVVPGSPATNAFDIANGSYGALPLGMPIVAVNGKQVGGADEFRALVKASPQILQLTVDQPPMGKRQYLVRLQY